MKRIVGTFVGGLTFACVCIGLGLWQGGNLRAWLDQPRVITVILHPDRLEAMGWRPLESSRDGVWWQTRPCPPAGAEEAAEVPQQTAQPMARGEM